MLNFFWCYKLHLCLRKLVITPFEGSQQIVENNVNIFIQKRGLDFYYILTCENCGFHASLLCWWQENLVLNHNRAVGGAILSDLRHLLKGFEFFPRFFTWLFAKFSECNAEKKTPKWECHVIKVPKSAWNDVFNGNYNEKALLKPKEDGFVTHFVR